jgi:FtsH-binding integral membrane protein
MPPQAPPGGFGGAGFDLEAQQAANFAAGFAEQQVRSRFVGKVLSIVFLQLLCTVGMSVLLYYVSPLKLYVRQNAWPFYLSWALSFGMLIAMACSETLRRKYPTNVLFLAAFTAVFSFQIAAVTSYFDTQAVMIAFIATTAVVLGCAFIAFFTKLDMTKYGGWLAIAGLSFMVVALIAAFWPWGGKETWKERREKFSIFRGFFSFSFFFRSSLSCSPLVSLSLFRPSFINSTRCPQLDHHRYLVRRVLPVRSVPHLRPPAHHG